MVRRQQHVAKRLNKTHEMTIWFGRNKPNVESITTNYYEPFEMVNRAKIVCLTIQHDLIGDITTIQFFKKKTEKNHISARYSEIHSQAKKNIESRF